MASHYSPVAKMKSAYTYPKGEITEMATFGRLVHVEGGTGADDC